MMGCMGVGVLDPPVEVGQEEMAVRLEARVATVVGRLNEAHVELVEIAALAGSPLPATPIRSCRRRSTGAS